MGEILLSLIIPTYNRLAVLKKTIDGLSQQLFPKDNFETIIIDDGSTDGTAEYLNESTIPLHYTFLRNSSNAGRARTRNRGIRAASGKIVLMIDDDILASKQLLLEHYNTHQKHNGSVAVVGAILVAKEALSTAVNDYLTGHHTWAYNEMLNKADNLPFSFCKTANLSLRKTVLDKIGGFNESFITYGGEDTELGKRLQQNGIKLLFAENATGFHYHNETMISLVKKFNEASQSTMLLKKLHPELTAESYIGFFSPTYNTVKTVRDIFYNLIKAILFTYAARTFNSKLIGFFNNKKCFRTIIIRYLLPVLKMQYFHQPIE